MSLITPLEPGAARGAPTRHPAMQSEQTLHTTLFGHIEAAVASACGSLHGVNEDAHSALTRSGPLFVVADGVGGGAMAAMASRQLVAHLHAALDGHRIGVASVRQAVQAADRAIAQSIAEITDQPGAATLALCAPVNALASKWLLAWVGDCRIYVRRSAAPLRALTHDDSFGQLNETPPPGGGLDDPARMVGNGAVSQANVAFTELGQGDLLIVCSDGVHKFVDAVAWERLLEPPMALVQQCEQTVALARSNGSSDDATVLLVRREGMGVQRPQWINRFVNGERTGR
ncbi:MAG TPA: PP2C family serine/threonine-protein phosphatase [Albitalea sp.]|nr:PP2C family serine/threonine-protein phosphatase [Albitalea sp.]